MHRLNVLATFILFGLLLFVRLTPFMGLMALNRLAQSLAAALLLLPCRAGTVIIFTSPDQFVLLLTDGLFQARNKRTEFHHAGCRNTTAGGLVETADILSMILLQLIEFVVLSLQQALRITEFTGGITLTCVSHALYRLKPCGKCHR
jgi:hypothetical protein